MEDYGSPALRALLQEFPGAVRATHADHGDCTALVEAGSIVAVMRRLRDDEALRFEVLADLCAVDYAGEGAKDERFEVVYHLYSVTHNHRVRIKARVPEDPCQIDSVVELWPAANWMEREVWDLYGVRFRNHPDLRRILLYEEFEGFPLRKDYPKERRQPLVGPRN